jgi:hypothetical protein
MWAAFTWAAPFFTARAIDLKRSAPIISRVEVLRAFKPGAKREAGAAVVQSDHAMPALPPQL